MSLTKVPVILYFDILSPFSYFGFELLSRYQKVWTKMDLKYKPVQISKIFEESGNSAPLLVPTKAAYLFKSIKLLNEFYKVINSSAFFIN